MPPVSHVSLPAGVKKMTTRISGVLTRHTTEVDEIKCSVEADGESQEPVRRRVRQTNRPSRRWQQVFPALVSSEIMQRAEPTERRMAATQKPIHRERGEEDRPENWSSSENPISRLATTRAGEVPRSVPPGWEPEDAIRRRLQSSYEQGSLMPGPRQGQPRSRVRRHCEPECRSR